MHIYTHAHTHAQQTASNYREEVRVFKQFHGNIVGKGGSTLRKIREETDTRIELPTESSDSDVIVIIGRKENVQKARARILAIEKEMVRYEYGRVSILYLQYLKGQSTYVQFRS